MIKSQTVVTIEKSFRSLIQSHNYEKYVLTIINKSQEIFKGLVFTGIEDQAHGESDYVDSNGQFYDAKLLFDEEQGRLIGDPKNDLDKWLQAMLDEKIEFGKWIRERTLSFLPETKLYQVMKERLVTVKRDENAIFFIPFPIADEYRNSVFLQYATDYLQAVYQQLVDEGMVGNRQVFFIYPSGDPHEYVLRGANGQREYIVCEELDDFILFETCIVTE